MSPIRPSPPRTPIPPRPLSVPPQPITLPMTPVASPAPAPATISTPVPPPVQMVASSPPLSRDWYVYQPDGRHIGPVSTWFLARGWVARQVPHDVFVGAAGEPQWRPLGQVQEIMEAVRALQSTGP